jgi:carboxyl-terminal processing protease
LDAVTLRLEEARKKDLTVHKDLLKSKLAEEIAIRYYFERGSTETRFRYDQELKEATRLLNNKSEYKNILKSI